MKLMEFSSMHNSAMERGCGLLVPYGLHLRLRWPSVCVAVCVCVVRTCHVMALTNYKQLLIWYISLRCYGGKRVFEY